MEPYVSHVVESPIRGCRIIGVFLRLYDHLYLGQQAILKISLKLFSCLVWVCCGDEERSGAARAQRTHGEIFHLRPVWPGTSLRLYVCTSVRLYV